jgi:hypothetical protein
MDMNVAIGPKTMIIQWGVALTDVPTKTLPMDLSLLAHLPVAQVKSAFFAPHTIQSILGHTEPALQYLICDELCLKGDT